MRPKSPLPRPSTAPQPAFTAQDIASALASQQIEGLQLDPKAEADLRQLVTGEISLAEMRSRALTRYRRPALPT